MKNKTIYTLMLLSLIVVSAVAYSVVYYPEVDLTPEQITKCKIMGLKNNMDCVSYMEEIIPNEIDKKFEYDLYGEFNELLNEVAESEFYVNSTIKFWKELITTTTTSTTTTTTKKV